MDNSAVNTALSNYERLSLTLAGVTLQREQCWTNIISLYEKDPHNTILAVKEKSGEAFAVKLIMRVHNISENEAWKVLHNNTFYSVANVGISLEEWIKLPLNVRICLVYAKTKCRLQAIKYHRVMTDSGLNSAKDAVEALINI